ncbi:cytochrome P450 [Streptomyces sp. XM83C]|uniref:cytochrome P450 n=1 Tax=Streptomyces sp. XM83C TaxID=2929781 RepID=UPI001FF7192B|nr:cytochrome P450 [Streptomyces sp. XM83C]MCK1820252.1 cytochrome P450 [Streptomyces sp. XM83C]
MPLRFAVEDIQLTEVTIRQGDAILVSCTAAGQDPAQHGPDAGEFDPTRERREHLAFGDGVHHCLGAPLARMEAGLALPRLFARFPAMRLARPARRSPAPAPSSPTAPASCRCGCTARGPDGRTARGDRPALVRARKRRPPPGIPTRHRRRAATGPAPTASPPPPRTPRGRRPSQPDPADRAPLSAALPSSPAAPASRLHLHIRLTAPPRLCPGRPRGRARPRQALRRQPARNGTPPSEAGNGRHLRVSRICRPRLQRHLASSRFLTLAAPYVRGLPDS